MRVVIYLFFFFSLLFSSEIKTTDDRSISLRLSTLGWNTNWNKHSINYTQLQSGGPSRDGIPPLNNPKFISIQKAKNWLKDNEPIIFVKINGQVKAYPLQIMIWHEIVNDTLDDKKIAITFCPLCNASIVFDRKLGKKTYEFGTSGLLRNSDLVMYDKQTESLWQQFTGTAIVGDETSKVLTQLPSSIISFKDLYTNFKDALVLSKETGYFRKYGDNPYVGYDDINHSPFMIHDDIDDRLAPKRRVATLSINGNDKAYAYNIVKRKKVINDTFEDKNIVLFYNSGISSALDKKNISNSKDIGSVVIYDRRIDGEILDFYYNNGFFDKQTGSKWNIFGEAINGKLKGKRLLNVVHGSHFWFAWVVFKPQTQIYK